MCSLLHINCVKRNPSHGVTLHFIPISSCIFLLNDIKITCRMLPQLSEISPWIQHGMHLVGAYSIVCIDVTSWTSAIFHNLSSKLLERDFSATIVYSITSVSFHLESKNEGLVGGAKTFSSRCAATVTSVLIVTTGSNVGCRGKDCRALFIKKDITLLSVWLSLSPTHMSIRLLSQESQL